ncbi:ATP phosphoribosyltransferase regulatory subunit [Pontimonas sp.]|uniref:histidine--tRNA ligase n=1 Tax=Pontimonas sp. TaxID=2304492 RepID=UPI00287087D4|nr:ATP phosphoribosyltransferase regulatory subunit [Pontimonas sp.]MDR9434673.1 ATP phosphoribosyltransferase regulatory subunit [Pontimonas sp.]
MAAKAGPPRGMRDFLPAEKRHRDAVLATISERYQQHGFDPIDTPALEDHDTLHSGLGGDNEKLSFQVLRRGLDTADLQAVTSLDELTDLGLRFDLTVPLARYVATHRAELPSVFRALHIAPVWRAERPQKGRYRQFVQCDIDIVGEASSLAERELLIASADALDALGVSGYRFRVNDRRLLTAVLEAAGVAPDQHLSVLITLDKLDKVGIEGVLDELTTRHGGQIDARAMRDFLERASEPVELDAHAIAQLMSATEDSAAELVGWAADVAGRIGPEKVVFDPTLVRGMGYYTGSIIELFHPELGVSLGGGGRYDGMVGRFLGDDVPACGFSLGFERLIDVVDSRRHAGASRLALVYTEQTPLQALLGVKAELIQSGHAVVLAQSKKNKKALFGELETLGVSRVAQVESEVPPVDELTWRELGE